MDRIESAILRSLLYHDAFTRRVLPYLNEEYFEDRTEKLVFNRIKQFIETYNNLPTKEALIIELDGASGMSQTEFDSAAEYLGTLESERDSPINEQWLVTQAEAWCQERAVHNAVMEVIHILDDKSGKKSKGNIPKLLQDALGVSFDSHVGHDYIEDAEKRYDFYHKVEKRIPFGLKWFNIVTKNGVPAKTLNIILAGTGCHAKGTPILLPDGTTRVAEAIQVGDRVMGPDGGARSVVCLHRGRAPMYAITMSSTKETFVVNGSHVLPLVNTHTSQKTTITVDDYLKASKFFKHYHKLYTVEQPVQYERPKDRIRTAVHLLGVCYGNGEHKKRRKSRRFTKGLRDAYWFGSESVRRELLAGFIDSDGCTLGKSHYAIHIPELALAKKVHVLALGLGFASRIDEEASGLFRVRIFPLTNSPALPIQVKEKQTLVPSKKQFNRSRFTVKPVGEDDYFGFEVDGDHLYLLGNYLVTHNSGKSLFLCDLAAHYLRMGKNVLYITLEMAEERIAERIDANLLDVSLDALKFIKRDVYTSRIAEIRSKTYGKLIIKEYPTAVAHAGHFRHLVNELQLKRRFTPDAVIIDYLNICASSRMKGGDPANGYGYVKAIAEELRGFGVENNVPVWTATQTTRSGWNNTDLELGHTSESAGVPATADFMFALIRDETLDALNQILVKVLKNRYSDTSQNRKFLVGVDRSKMKLFDLDDAAQQGLSEANQVGPSVAPPEPKLSASLSAELDDVPFDLSEPAAPVIPIARKKTVDFGLNSFSSKRDGKPKKQLKV